MVVVQRGVRSLLEGRRGRGRDDCEIANLVKRGGRGERERQRKERACNLFKGVFAHYKVKYTS